MGYWLDEPRDQHEYVKVRTLWVTIALSFLVHTVALLLVVERTHLLGPEEGAAEQPSERLQVRLTAPPKPVPAVIPEPPRENVALPKPARASRPPAPKEPPPPVLASTAPARPIAVPALPAPAPAPPSPPIDSDMWSYIQARRRERGQSEAPDNQKAEANANLAANLPAAATGVATPDRNRGGGIFEIKRMDYDDAAFLFYGWNKEMGRKTPQLIEVRKGDNSDMHIAVVRKMIAIIREYSKDDFVWHSPRHDTTLSARLQDNAALEDFLMHDFFDEPGPTRRQ